MNTTIVTRTTKGGRLSVAEMDANLNNLKATADAAAPQSTTYTKTEVNTAITSATPSFSTLTGKPTTLSGYGITDAMTATATNAAIQAVVGAAPAALDTLVEIAAQLASDESAASALTTAVSLKAPLASPVFTGNVTGLGIATGTSFNSITGLSSTTPLIEGTATVGTGTTAARADHVHPVNSAITLSTAAQPNITSVGTLTELTVTATITGSVSGNAATVTTNANLTGEVISSGNATTVTNAAVIGKVLTGYSSTAGTISATDTVLSAINKLNGNDGLFAPLASPSLTGTPVAPTAAALTNTTQIATTAFVTNAVADGGLAPWIVKTTTYTAVAGNRILAATATAAFTITLPASPSVGQEVRISDASGTFSTNNLTVANNGSNILGAAGTLVLDVANQSVNLVYFNATRGWIIAS